MPIIGTQWHVEAYADEQDNFNFSLIRYMILAGSAFDIKQTMLRELRRVASNSEAHSIPTITTQK